MNTPVSQPRPPFQPKSNERAAALEEAARIAEELACAAFQRWRDEPQCAHKPYVDNRLYRLGQDIAAAIRERAKGSV